jgi:hypothetical protein
VPLPRVQLCGSDGPWTGIETLDRPIWSEPNVP